ncbi:hypothetical protein H310_14264 [Aphanomyces invadans]|uniref:Peptidase S1 domain-containing protein n=1 Tax=Aphanomyces invadans TaxID=157072 RepID=A0A024TAK2_9STRA|nr:hypothetical protein H310_14264 [Aphanomyces invadans]ETV91024.1 hypothetical protein H310_14264 [Aphanomyces invadans]|eukprot:XP_008880304.1 hypothetical protein H310_14264 [Aphanomyces invadans]
MTSLLALAALSAFAAARPEIFGGIDVPVGEFKYVASLRETEAGPTLCGATLIAPKVLLTSAFCVDLSPNYASIGSHNSIGDKDGERIKIVKKTVHPMYNDELLDYDIAILELETESKFAPVALNSDEYGAIEPGTDSWVRGFGYTSFHAKENSPVLLEAKVNIMSNDECNEAVGKTGKILDSMLCTNVASKGPCDNDYGGPLIIIRDGVEYVAGVSIWTLGCDDPSLPSVYLRVSVASDFIKPFLPETPRIPKPAC